MSERYHTNPTAVESYSHSGPGRGDEGRCIEWLDNRDRESDLKIAPLLDGKVCLEVGFGEGVLLERAMNDHGCHAVYGVDIANACSDSEVVLRMKNREYSKRVNLWCLDASHVALPMPDDWVDIAFCTEAIEHMSNPFHMFAEVKRVLKHGGLFVMSFPQPEDNLGFKSGQHAHVYPGFLQRESFELFCKQMYFKQVYRDENGSSAWYVLKNYKGPGIVDAFEMTWGNHSEEQLFGCMENF